MTTEENVQIRINATPEKVELPVLAQQKVLALHAARAVVHTQGSIFGGSSVPDTAGVGGLITIADYILAKPEEPDVITAEEADQIPNVTGKVGPRIRHVVMDSFLGPALVAEVDDTPVTDAVHEAAMKDARIRKIPVIREVVLPEDVETVSYHGDPGYWVVAVDRRLMFEFENKELEDAVRDWPGLQSEKGNPVREVTNGVVTAKQVYDAFINEWVTYQHGGRL